MPECIACGKLLVDKQKIYCSRKCVLYTMHLRVYRKSLYRFEQIVINTQDGRATHSLDGLVHKLHKRGLVIELYKTQPNYWLATERGIKFYDHLQKLVAKRK